MVVYFSMILFTFLVGSLKTNNSRKFKISWLQLIVLLAVWVFIYAFRYNTGTDFSGYYYMFKRMGIVSQTFAEYMSTKRDFLFYALQYFVYHYFNGSWIVFSVIIGVLTYLPILLVLKKESNSFGFSILLYIFTLNYFSGFNGIRQGVAISIIFWAYSTFFKENKYIPYFIAMIIAFGFHSTVIFVIPFHFLAKKKINSKIFKIVVAMLLFTYAFLWGLWGYLIKFLETIGQDKLAEDYASAMANGSSSLRMIVYILPAIIAIIFYKTLKEKHEDIDSEIMLVLLAGIFMLFSMKYWLFARIAIYFHIFSILLIPKLECIFTKNSKRLGMMLIGGLYFVYMCAMLLHGDGGCLPYTFIDLTSIR